ncbi:MAG: glycosyl transferase family 1, partial [Candidatus Omnitrophica bacterium]|nr:glycosyl transferase family 1 [Candidatus Omnitrophota bacterium]
MIKQENLTIEAYRDVAPAGAVDLIYSLAAELKGRSFLHVNSTRAGGGVAEMLLRLVPIFNA